jgi:glycosyltransferase involved in cell wall biosynthesis
MLNESVAFSFSLAVMSMSVDVGLISRSKRLRHLMLGPPPEEDRVFYHNIWFRGHNNPRYAELLPRLERLDPFLVLCSDRRVLRGVQFRVLRASRALRHKAVFALASRRYRGMLTTDTEQIPYFGGAIVADVDDPKFSKREASLLNRPNVAAYVVTAERAAERFQKLGVRKPHYVIPQGVSLRSASERLVNEVADRHRKVGEIIIGYVASSLLLPEDPGGRNPLFNVSHLLDLWQEIQGRLPQARLWLVGRASNRLRRQCEDRKDILLFGRVPKDEVLSYVANFDIALYPRTEDQGIQAAKVAEYLGAGVPTVSYDYRVTQNLKDTGGGVTVATPGEFVEAVIRLGQDRAAREEMAARAKAAGQALDWDVLASRYEREILARHLS